MLSINQLKEATGTYGSDKLYVVEINQRGYWETLKVLGSLSVWASNSEARNVVRTLSAESLNGYRYRVVTYAPIGAS